MPERHDDEYWDSERVRQHLARWLAEHRQSELGGSSPLACVPLAATGRAKLADRSSESAPIVHFVEMVAEHEKRRAGEHP